MTAKHDELFRSRRLSAPVRWHSWLVRESLERPLLNRTLRVLQREIGSRWILGTQQRLMQVHGLERLPTFDLAKSYLCVANHRSFFDMYLITALLVRRGLLPHRILFPVRSELFYDSWLGIPVNGLMSFFAMYPPIFRDAERASLNVASLEETARLLRDGGAFCGIHPEGKRGHGDPYTLLPAHRGVGKVIHGSKAIVLPVFINGIHNDMLGQLRRGITGKGDTIHVVYGAPVPLEDLLALPAGPRTDRALTERVMSAISALAEEERALRAAG